MMLSTEVHPEHPLAAQQRNSRLAAWIGASCVLLAAMWAFWRQGDPGLATPPPPERPAQIASSKVAPALDLAAFSAPVWDAPPIPPKPVVVTEKPPAPPPPPLKIQLLGIVRDEQPAADGSPVYIAAVYDETTDKLLMLRAGDTIGASGAGRIARVHADAVELSEPAGLRRLALRQPIAPIPGLSAAPTPSAKPGTGKP